MFFSDYIKCMNTNHRMNFTEQYNFWYNQLFLRMCNLFIWDGLPLKSRHIEINTHRRGFSSICKINGKLYALNGEMSGETVYQDEFKFFLYTNPILGSGVLDIGVNAVIVRNNDLYLSSKNFVNRYAYLLAHADLSFQAVLINSRSTGIIGTPNDKVAENVKDYYNKLVDGSMIAVVDDEGMETILQSKGLRKITDAFPSSQSIKDYYDATRNILRDFYQDIGVRVNYDKKERNVEAEITSNDSMLLFNVSNMLDCRKEAVEEMNKIFGTNGTVKLNKNIGGDLLVTNQSNDKDSI